MNGGMLAALGRRYWELARPEGLPAYLESECAAIEGARLIYLPDAVRITERHSTDASIVRGKRMVRTWPSCMGWSADGAPLLLEAIASSDPHGLRLSLVYHKVFDALVACARSGGQAWVLARSNLPADYLLPVSREGLIGEWRPDALVPWSNMQGFKARLLRDALTGS